MDDKEQGRLIRAGTWLDDHWPPLVALLGTVGAAVGGVILGLGGFSVERPEDLLKVPWGLFIVGVLTQIVGTVAGWSRSETLSKVKEERDDLKREVGQAAAEFFLQLDKELSVFANDVLELTDTERVSVYVHHGTAFSMLGRYSRNPNFNRRGRSIYPDNQGCIGHAWAHGRAFVGDLPDYEADPDTYVARLGEDWGIPSEVATNFNMKSRAVAAFAIEDTTEAPVHRFAVLVVESVKMGMLDVQHLEAPLAQEDNTLIRFLIRTRPLHPDPGLAKEAGF